MCCPVELFKEHISMLWWVITSLSCLQIDTFFWLCAFPRCVLSLLVKYFVLFVLQILLGTWQKFVTLDRILDNLPVAVPRQRRDGSLTPSYEHGYRVGIKVRYTHIYCSSSLLNINYLYSVKLTFVIVCSE